MGITNNKEDEIDNEIETINKSQILHTQNIIDNKEYAIVTKLTSEYNDLTNHPEPSMVKIRLRRLKKWIYMAKTINEKQLLLSSNIKNTNYFTPIKHNINPFISVKRTFTYDDDNGEHNTSKRKTQLEILPQDNNEYRLTDNNYYINERNNILHTEVPKHNNDKSDDSDDNNINYLNVKNVQISEYSDTVIENGLTNYYKENKNKFIERVLKGPPNPFRILAWFILSNIHMDDVPFKDDNLYNYYLYKETNTQDEDNSTLEQRIRKDIDRTFPKILFNQYNTNHMESLFNILKSYASFDTKVNYCQGMNIISAFILIITNFNEIDSFHLLLSLFTKQISTDVITFEDNNNSLSFSIRGLFIEGFPLLHFMNYAFEKIFEKYLPQLKIHFDILGVPVDLITCKWFQTLFTILLPIDFLKRLWDYIFVYGIFFMFNFAITLLSFFENELLSFKEEFQIDEFFINLRKCALHQDSSQFYIKNAKIEILFKNARKLKINYKQYYDMYIKDEDSSFEQTITEIENELHVNDCYIMVSNENQFDSESVKKNIIYDTIETVEEFKNDDDSEYYDDNIDEGVIESDDDYENDFDEHRAQTDATLKKCTCMERNIRNHLLNVIDIITLQDIRNYFDDNKHLIESPYKRRTLTSGNLNETLNVKTKKWISKKNTRYFGNDNK